jgi:hypothetical protein
MTPARVTAEEIGYFRRDSQSAEYVTIPLAVLQEAVASLSGGDAHALLTRVLEAAVQKCESSELDRLEKVAAAAREMLKWFDDEDVFVGSMDELRAALRGLDGDQ